MRVEDDVPEWATTATAQSLWFSAKRPRIVRPQVSSWTGDRAIHRYDVVVYLNQHLTLWITNEDWPTLVRCDLCLILWSAELYLHWCVSVCVCSGNSQEERGLWESEGLVALDTWRHVSPALLPSPHPTLFMSSAFSAPPLSRSRKTESRWSQMNVNALKINSIFRSCIRAPPRQSLLQSNWCNAAFHCSWKHQWPVSPARRRPLSATLCWCVNVFFTVCQTARRVGEWERQTAAEDKGGSSVQATYRHRCTPGPQHLQVSLSCLFVSVGTLVHNKQKEELLNKVSEPFLSHRMFFWPPPEELHCHFPLIKPRGGSPPFPSVSSSTFLFSLSQRMLGD